MDAFSENRNVCKECRKERRREIYSNDTNAKKIILDRNKKYRTDNQEKYREHKREYERNNKDAAKKRSARFREINSAAIALKKRLEYVENSEKIKLKVTLWRKENLPKKRANNLKRRARVSGAKGFSYTTSVHIQMRWELWGGRCWVCGCKAEATDHVIPLCDGGSHWPSNLRPICKSCNSKRRKKYEGIEKSNIGNAIVPQLAAEFIRCNLIT